MLMQINKMQLVFYKLKMKCNGEKQNWEYKSQLRKTQEVYASHLRDGRKRAFYKWAISVQCTGFYYVVILQFSL